MKLLNVFPITKLIQPPATSLKGVKAKYFTTFKKVLY